MASAFASAVAIKPHDDSLVSETKAHRKAASADQGFAALLDDAESVSKTDGPLKTTHAATQQPASGTPVRQALPKPLVATPAKVAKTTSTPTHAGASPASAARSGQARVAKTEAAAKLAGASDETLQTPPAQPIVAAATALTQVPTVLAATPTSASPADPNDAGTAEDTDADIAPGAPDETFGEPSDPATVLTGISVSQGRAEDLQPDDPVPVGAVSSASGGTSHAAAETALVPGQATTASGAAAQTTQAPQEQVPQSPLSLPAPPTTQVAIMLIRSVGADATQGFTLQLKPEHLGTVDVRLDVDAKGKASATISADRPETLRLLQQDAHHLVRALNEAGVSADLGGLSFSLKDAGNGSGGSARGQSETGRQPSTQDNKTPPLPVEAAAWRSNRLYDIHA